MIAGDVDGLSGIFAEDYVQYDESGNACTKHDVLAKLASGAIRFVSMFSTGRQIAILRDNLAIVHGAEDDMVEQGGERFPVRYGYTDVAMKRDGRWQIVGSQLARPFGKALLTADR